MSKRVLLPIVIILFGLAAFWGLTATKAEKKSIERPDKVWLVKTVPVEFQRISPEITIYGRVETPRTASINAAITADISDIHFFEGQYVNQGDLLISLDNRDAELLVKQRQADLAQINASIDSEKARYRRDKNLLADEKALLGLTEKAVTRARKLDQSRLVTRSSLDDAVAEQQRQLVAVKRLEHDITEHSARLAGLVAQQTRAKAQLEQAKLDVSRSLIRAPFTGKVAQLTVSIGDRVRAGDNLVTVYDLASLEVRAQIPTRHLTTIRDSLASGVLPKANAVVDGKPLSFELMRLSGEARQDSGGIDGLFRLLNTDQPLVLGSFVELSMSLKAEDNVVVVPFNTLYGLNRVYQIDSEGYLEALSVERIGEYESDNGEKRLLIRGGDLVEGQQLVATQLPNAITGLKVKADND